MKIEKIFQEQDTEHMQMADAPITNEVENNISGSRLRKLSRSRSCDDDVLSLDECSIRGMFGWVTIATTHVPYILRNEERYCAVRMLEAVVFAWYLSYFRQSTYNCMYIQSYYLTESEAKLLNEINHTHCGSQYGNQEFKQGNLTVTVSDAIEACNFLESCCTILQHGIRSVLNRFGFIQINNASVIPYTVLNDEKYIPLLYLEGETKELEQKVCNIEGWDLSYLKFCCKLQGVRSRFLDDDSWPVISLNEVENHFPLGTEFKEFWPSMSAVNSEQLITSQLQFQNIQWVRVPPGESPTVYGNSTFPSRVRHNVKYTPTTISWGSNVHNKCYT